MKNSKTKKVEEVKKIFVNSAFNKPVWSKITYQEDENKMNPQLVIKDETKNRLIKVSGIKLEDILLIKCLHKDLQEVLFSLGEYLNKNRKEILSTFVNSEEFQRICWRNNFASCSPWRYAMEGRDHLAGDSVILTKDGENIYIFGVSDSEQDSICLLRNSLAELIEMSIEICGNR